MCGRYTLAAEAWELAERFGFEVPDWAYAPNYNVAPSQQVMIVTNEVQRRAEMVRWGLVPFWAKDIKIGFKMVNARAETVATSGAFKHALKRRRCLVLADGFYEWKKEVGTRTPIRIGIKEWEPFAFAGLWESWKNKESGEELRSCTIITCTPNDLMESIHDRMPVILPERAESVWLDLSPEDGDTIQDLLVPYPAGAMKSYVVSDLVNSVKNNTPDCILAR